LALLLPSATSNAEGLGSALGFANWCKKEVGAKNFLLQPICPQPKLMLGGCNGSDAGLCRSSEGPLSSRVHLLLAPRRTVAIKWEDFADKTEIQKSH